jgi:hypothetical protein
LDAHAAGDPALRLPARVERSDCFSQRGRRRRQAVSYIG